MSKMDEKKKKEIKQFLQEKNKNNPLVSAVYTND
jgi:hypothetical protein